MRLGLHARGAQAEVARDDGLGLEDLRALVLRDEVGEPLRLSRGRGGGGRGRRRLRLRLRLGRGAVDTEGLPRDGGGGVDGLADVKELLSEAQAEGAVRPADDATVRLFNLEVYLVAGGTRSGG